MKLYKFLVEPTTQETFFKESHLYSVFYPDGSPWLIPAQIPVLTSDHWARTVHMIECNSSHEWFKEFCEDRNLEIFHKVKLRYFKVTVCIAGFGLEWSNFTYFDGNIHRVMSFAKPDPGEYRIYTMNSGWWQNEMIVSIDNRDYMPLQPISNEKLKYRIYMNDRMLVERVYPDDMHPRKALMEEVWLEVEDPVFRFETSAALKMTQIQDQG